VVKENNVFPALPAYGSQASKDNILILLQLNVKIPYYIVRTSSW